MIPWIRRMDLQSQSSKGIHDEVHPKQLYGSQNTMVFVVIDGCDKGQEDSSDVHSNLKLI
jgi:hypothetical protein